MTDAVDAGLDPKARKIAAKRFKETLKLASNNIYTVAFPIFGAALIRPSVKDVAIRN